MLFISTEIMFFFSLFWAFFHGSLSPAIAFDNSWPPKGISVINAFGPPIWGTWVLWMSSIYALYIKDLMLLNFIQNWAQILRSFNALLILAILFTICQLFEFYLATFSFREGLYGSIFYLLTGFHGIHVIIGTIFLMICWIRYYLNLSREIYNFQTFFKGLFLTFYNFFNVEPILNDSLTDSTYLNKSKFSKISEFLLFKNKLKVNVTNSYIKNLNKNWWQPYHFTGLETGIWYWQFVDIVWIFVWIIIYVWGNNSLPFAIKLELQQF
jgi:heme/copper-type cytochrome/quinol oxidase subunit 3